MAQEDLAERLAFQVVSAAWGFYSVVASSSEQPAQMEIEGGTIKQDVRS